MYAEEFILIPKRMYMSKVSSAKREILENTNIKQKASQLSLLQRKKSALKPVITTKPNTTPRSIQTVKPEIKTIAVNTVGSDSDEIEYEGDDEENDNYVGKIKEEEKMEVDGEKLTQKQILQSLSTMDKGKYTKAYEILDIIINTKDITWEGSEGIIYIEDEPTELKIIQFLYNLQQPTKKLDHLDEYDQLITLLGIKSNQIRNTHAKDLINQIPYARTTRQSEREENSNDYEDDEEEEESYHTLPQSKTKWFPFST